MLVCGGCIRKLLLTNNEKLKNRVVVVQSVGDHTRSLCCHKIMTILAVLDHEERRVTQRHSVGSVIEDGSVIYAIVGLSVDSNTWQRSTSPQKRLSSI